MDAKYIYKTISLPEHAAKALDKAKTLLEQEMGLKLSSSQAVQVLSVQYANRREGK
jgi:hypothetical protein